MGAGDGFAATGGITSNSAVADGFSDGTAEAGISDKTPGTIASDGKTYLAVATGEGWFMVSDLQLAGKKRMAVDDFLRGWRNPEAYKAV
jgi:methionyl-tRNA formyltransferase